MKTTDICDEYGDLIKVADPLGFKHYGGRKEFSGQIETIKCHEDNSLVRTAVATPGGGKVLVVDGGGSLRCALLGDLLADMAQKSAWEGIVVYGCIRDSEVIATLDLGVMALSTHPRKSEKRNMGMTNLVVNFAGISFVPGHFLYADSDGIVTSERAVTLAGL
jgi:regulator of ribonuclease activity A